MKKTAIYETHLKLGAKMIGFAGWKMPFSYSNPTKEHLSVREHGGLFDISHMGEIRVKGSDSLNFLESLVPTNVQNVKKGKCQYSVFCNKDGGLIDDIIIYCIEPSKEYFLCVNAGAIEKDKSWLDEHKKSFSVEVTDESDQWAMMAVQGPKALDLCGSVFPDIALSDISRFQFAIHKGLIFSRTGYTGEDGFEIYIPWNQFSSLWESFLEKGKDFSIGPVGLGARDTLRLEMAYLLSGQDFDESRNPVEAGLSQLLKNDKDYVGKSKIFDKKKPSVSLKAFITEQDLGVPRKGYSVLSNQGEELGVVTSGAKSPSLEKMIGLAYISDEEKDCFLDIRGSKVRINIVEKPFLKK